MMEYISAVECHPDTMMVGGSNPPTPTKAQMDRVVEDTGLQNQKPKGTT